MPRGSFKRKLTAIMSADVKSYSLFMGEDEAERVKTLTAYRKTMGGTDPSAVRKRSRTR